MPDVEGLKVLEIGTGTGLIALTIALKKAEKVVATDINPNAISNARHNVKKHNMESIIELVDGDIFVPFRKDKPKFDLIFWNIPFCYVDAELKSEIGLHDKLNDLEKSVFNPYYYSLIEYLNEGSNFLAEGGRLLLGFSPTIGKADDLENITNLLGLDKAPVVVGNVEIEGNVETLQILEFKKKR
jgi:methylase of polypeptide subunit release factors